MKKKLAWMLALVLLLAAVCAVAAAENEKIYTVTLGSGQSKNRSLHMSDKVALRPSRGTTINTFIFNRTDYSNRICFDYGEFIDMNSGKYIDKVSLSCYGVPSIKVESGSNWLDVEMDNHYNGTYSFDIIAKTNDYRSMQRKGSVVISDSRGTLLRIKVTQCSDAWVKSVKQLDGSAHDREVRVQTSRVQGVAGKVIYYESYPHTEPCGSCFWCEMDPSYCNDIYIPTDFYPIKYTKGTIWFDRGCSVGLYHAYHVGMYKVIAGRRHLGGGTRFILQHRNYDYYYYKAVYVTH